MRWRRDAIGATRHHAIANLDTVDVRGRVQYGTCYFRL